MKGKVCFAVFALLAAGLIAAQAPKGWLVRTDRSTSASDPDAAGAVKLMAMGSGFHVMTPQAAVFWNPANAATGNYTLKGTFTLIKSTGYDEYYGLVFGGSDLDGSGQAYLYFMITDDGTWMVKHRMGPSTETVLEKTPNAAIKKPDSSGKSTNILEVRVMPDKIGFVVNGVIVGTAPRTGLAAKPDGIYGIRSNHHLELQVDGLGVSK
jgi:hypothetical protein